MYLYGAIRTTPKRIWYEKLPCWNQFENYWKKIYYAYCKKYAFVKTKKIQRVSQVYGRYQYKDSGTQTQRAVRCRTDRKKSNWEQTFESRILSYKERWSISTNNDWDGKFFYAMGTKTNIQKWKAFDHQTNIWDWNVSWTLGLK